MQGSGALKRMMMLDIQRIENKTLLQLPRLNTVLTILQVFGEREAERGDRGGSILANLLATAHARRTLAGPRPLGARERQESRRGGFAVDADER